MELTVEKKSIVYYITTNGNHGFPRVVAIPKLLFSINTHIKTISEIFNPPPKK